MKENENEIFKDIPNYEGLYQVSNLGRVKSFIRHNGTTERILSPVINGKGYYHVNLYKNKKPKNITVHQLVSITFLGHKSDGHKIVVDHVNNNRLDNRVSNLQLISNRENVIKSRLLNENLTSKFTGVSFCKRDQQWTVQIRINKKRITLGLFYDEIVASKIYQKAYELMDQYTGCNKSFRKLIKSSI